MSEPSDSALLPLKFDAALYDRTFWRRLLVDGLLNQSVLPTRTKFLQGFEQILESFREEQAGHPVQLRWFLIEIMSEIVMEPNVINWNGLFEQSNRGLEQFLEVLHMVLQMEHSTSNEKNPFENPFRIVDTDCKFNPLALALHLLDLFVVRPIMEGPETARPMSNDNTRYDKMGVWLLKLSTECVEILRKQGGGKWSRKIGKDAEHFQELIGLDKQHGGKGIIEELYQSLYQLPAPTQLNQAPGSSVKPVVEHPHPRCKSFQSRSAAVALVRSIVGGNHATLNEFVRHMKGFQDSYLKNGVKEWEFKLPNDDTVAFGNDSAVPYQGIKNLGNTCYINALMQQLFTIPELRRNILRIELTPKDMPSADPKQSVVIQLQEIMSALQYGARGSATTEGFCKSFKDWDGKPINPAIQDDSGLFFTRLVDKLNEDLKPTPYANVIKQTLCGQLCNQLIGIDPNECTHSKSSYEEFTTLQLEIKNKKNLQQSLQAYVEGELLNGSNCFRCSICNKKVPTLKRTVVSKLPKTMSLMLKRFEMDYQSMTTNKINDFLEFPTRLNMKAFTLEGQQQEQQQRMKQQQSANADSKQPDSEDDEKASYHSTEASADANAPPASTPAPAHPDEYYEYVLRGVVIHSGTVGAGHYYSYIQGRDDLNWYEMNDNRVSHFNFNKDFQTECFGGKESYASAWSTGTNKSRSAYLLFYDRVVSELVIDPNQVAKTSFRVAATALSFLARLRRKWSKSRQLLSPSAINAAESKGKAAALALQQSSYNSMLKSLSDFLAYHPYSSYTFHMELMKECQAGFRFLKDPQWTSANQHADNVDPLSIAQYAWRYFTLIYLRSFHHNSLTKEWSTLWLNLFTIKNEEEASVFQFEHILPLATWILEEFLYVKPEPKSSSSSSSASAVSTTASSSSSKVSVVDDMCPLPPTTSTSKLGSKMRASDDLASSAPSSKSLKRSRADDTEMTSMDDSRLSTWNDLTGDDDDSYAHTMPPFDAPNSLLFQYLISCPEIDIRDTTFDLFSNISLLFIKYQSLHRETTLAPILEKLVDHLCTFIPFLPYYANKSLILYLRLVHHLCRESQLVLNRFLLKSDTVNNHLLGRLLDMFVGGVTLKENPCGNSVNHMTLASATARRYYPIVRETLSDRTQWKRTYWLLLSLLVSHSDTTPLCEASNNKPLESDTNEKKEESSESKSSSVAGMQDIPLDEVKTSDQSPDVNASPSTQPDLVKRRSSVGSNASSTDGLEFDPPVPLSTACVEFFLFSPFLDSILTESFNVARMPAISQLMVSLCTNNYQYSLRLVQALFHALQHSDSNAAYYTLIRALLDMKDLFREKRVEAIMSHWLRLFETDQMYWNPMDSSLNYLLTLLLKNEELVQWMHLHCKEWVWLIEWLQNNRVKPSIYQSDTSAVQLDRPKQPSSRSSLYRSGSSLDDAWRTGTSWERPSFNSRPLGEFSQNPFADDSTMRSVMDDEDETESTEMEDIGGQSMFTPRPHRLSSLANRKNARKNLTAGVMLTATKFTIKEKWKLLCRLRDGTELIGDEAPEETAAVQAAIGDPASASNFAASSSSSSSSARTNNVLDNDYWDMNTRSDIARAANRVLNGSTDRGSASGDEDDDFMRGQGDMEADIESGFALASSGLGSRPQHMIYSKGMPVDAKHVGGPYGSIWKPAVIVAVEEKRIKVHYTDDESIQDEWITNIDKRIAARNSMTSQSTDMYA